MKTLIFTSIVIGFSTVASTFAADPIEFKQVNSVIQAVSDYVIAQDDMFDSALPEFDPQFCDLQKERLKYDMKASIKSSPWLEGSPSQGEFSTSFAVDRSYGHTGVRVDASSKINTQVLDLVRYSGMISLKKANHMNPKFEARILGHFKRMSTVQSLDDWHTLILSNQQLSLEMIRDELHETEKKYECAKIRKCYPDYEPLDQLLKQYQDDIKLIKEFESTFSRVEISTESNQGKISKIIVHAPNSMIPEKDRAKVSEFDLTLEFTLDSISLRGLTFVSVKHADLDKLHEDTQRDLKLIAAGDQVKKNKLENSYRRVLIDIKKFLRGQIR